MSDYPKKAFPYEESYMNHGMDLRDYFAAKALQGFLANPKFNKSEHLAVKCSYEIADAMMKARVKK